MTPVQMTYEQIEFYFNRSMDWYDFAQNIISARDFQWEKMLAANGLDRMGWLRAVDEEMVTTGLGVANLSDSYDSAKQKLNSLINWHIDVATDPRVNGGFHLQQKVYDVTDAQPPEPESGFVRLDVL